MRKTFIYYLKHPSTLEIRYIGKTVKPLSCRLSNHINNAKKAKHNKHLSNWINSVIQNGERPIIGLLEICEEYDWKEQEKFWISLYSNLVNATLGGDGCEGLKHSQETIEKIRSINLGRKHTEAFKKAKSDFFANIPRSQEWKDNIAKARKGYKPTEEALKNQSLAHKGYTHTEEQKEKIRQALKGRKRPQEVIDKIKRTKNNKNKDIVES